MGTVCKTVKPWVRIPLPTQNEKNLYIYIFIMSKDIIINLRIIVLDIEGTLISNAVSIFPRHDLFKFLTFLKKKCDEIVIMTYLDERVFRKISKILCEEESVPNWFGNLKYIDWKEKSSYKDLRFVSDDITNIYIIDDMENYILPEQKGQWIQIKSFERPYKKDNEFKKIMKML